MLSKKPSAKPSMSHPIALLGWRLATITPTTANGSVTPSVSVAVVPGSGNVTAGPAPLARTICSQREMRWWVT
jgi:hypothetical protein